MAKSFTKKVKLGVLWLVIVVVVVGSIPIRYLAAPQWDLFVRDQAGKPLKGMYVRLSYTNYSAESEGHELTLVTDHNGHVNFPVQYRTASLLQRALYTVRSAMGGVHASFGNHAFVFAFGNCYEGEAVTGSHVTDWGGSPTKMESTIIAKRMETAH